MDKAKLLDEKRKVLDKHVDDAGMVVTAKFLLCGGVVKDIIEQKLIEGNEKNWFDNSCKLPYSSAVHAKDCLELYGEIVVMGSGLENIGPAKLIMWKHLLRGKSKEEITDTLKEIMPLRGNDIKARYLEMKGETIEPPCLCETYEEKIIEVCAKCGKEKKEKAKVGEGQAARRVYKINKRGDKENLGQ